VRASSDARVAEATATLPASVDLHARPAADFVRAAMRSPATIRVAVGERDADAKSLLAVLALGAKGGTPLGLTAEGDGAAEAVAGLVEVVTGLTE
jgi:phosphotransferase system HPr (HPr) family protein